MRLGIAGDSLAAGSQSVVRIRKGHADGTGPTKRRVMELRDRALLERQTTMGDERDRGLLRRLGGPLISSESLTRARRPRF